MGVEWGGNEPRVINPTNLHNGNLTVTERAMVNMGNLAFKVQDAVGLLEHDPSIEEVASRGEKLFTGLQAGSIALLGTVVATKYGL